MSIWKHIPRKYKWLATDKNGDAWFFTDKPREEGTEWQSDEEASRLFEETDWQSTLQERPSPMLEKIIAVLEERDEEELASLLSTLDIPKNAFDKASALEGKPVMLSSGSKAWIRYEETEIKTDYPLVGIDEEDFLYRWDEGGYCSSGCLEDDIAGMWDPFSDVISIAKNELPTAKFIAKDQDGDWFAYEDVPCKDDEMWSSDGGAMVFVGVFPALSRVDWKDSLISL